MQYDVQSPLPYIYLSYISKEQNDFSAAIEYCDKAIELSVKQNPDAKEPGVEVARYIQMLCEMDAQHPKCIK